MVNVASRIDPLLMRVSGGRMNLTKANAFYAGYDGYQTLAGDREIPVVICSPRS
jgi:hypothetical protein